MSEKSKNVPVTIITGFLGVGKTTAILDLLAHHRPEHERWAILVNDFGEVGIDGPIIEGSGREVTVKQIPGGCICCTSGLKFQANLTRLIERERPDRVLIEPTGLAKPGPLLDMIVDLQSVEPLAPRATITLVDPAQFLDETYRSDEVFRDQVEAADVLVANRSDLYDEAALHALESSARALFPPKLIVATTRHGALDPSWLDLEPAHPRSRLEVDPDRRKGPMVLNAIIPGVSAPRGPSDVVRTRSNGKGVRTGGWLLGSDFIFSGRELTSWIRQLHDEEMLFSAFMRMKAILRTDRGWSCINATAGAPAQSRATNYRRDSRIEVIVGARAPTDWDVIESRLLDCLTPTSKALFIDAKRQ